MERKTMKKVVAIAVALLVVTSAGVVSIAAVEEGSKEVSALSCNVYVKIDDDTCAGYEVYVDGVYQFTEGQDGTPDGYCAFYVSAGTHKFELRKNGCTTSKSWYCECGTVHRWVSMPDYWCECEDLEDLSEVVFKEPVKPQKMSSKVAALIPPKYYIIPPPPELVVVDIYLITGTETEDIETLKKYTEKIMYRKENRIVAEIDTEMIEKIANLTFVSYLGTPLKAQLFPVDEVDKGVQCFNADTQHGRDFTGKGVKVAIVDFGFANYKKCQDEGFLPKNLKVQSFREDGNITAGEKHGTACAEIVHAVAPDAELYLISYDGYDYQLKERVLPYLISEKVDVVSHSAGLNAGLFDGTDDACKIIDDAVFKHGIIWVNAAGDYAQRHWEGSFRDKNGNCVHEYPNGEMGQMFRAEEGNLVVLHLSWNDTWCSATQDYDMYICNSSGGLVNNYFSVNPQHGSSGQVPCEDLSFIAPYNDSFSIVIHRYISDSSDNQSTIKPVHFELYSGYHDLTCPVLNSSLCVEATAFGSIAAGAVSSADHSTLESFSSRGPTNDRRIKPDFVGPTCVSTCAYAGRFCGTSASAPYVAGALALQLYGS